MVSRAGGLATLTVGRSVVSVILTADKDQSLTHDAEHDVRDAALRSDIGRVLIDPSDFTDVADPFSTGSGNVSNCDGA
jgi:hypothetical protein